MRQILVWMLTAHFFPVIGGAERQTQQISANLKRHFGWSTHVITRRQSNRLPDNLPASEIIDDVPVIRVVSHSGLSDKFDALVYMLATFWYLLRHGRRSIYHAQDEFGSAWIAVVASRMLGGRSVIKLRTGCYFYNRAFGRGLARKLFFFRLRLAHHLIVVNSEVKAFLLAGHIPAERVTLVPNGVDTTYFRPPSAAERAEARRHLGFDDSVRVVLYVGRLQHLKGPDLLFDAWQNLSPETIQNALLILAGDGPDYEALAQRAGAAVRMAGMIDSIREYYWAADVFILPSRTEGLSNALLEAMACGVPPVGSATGGALDVITHGQNGYLFESENVPAMTAMLEQVLSAPDEWPHIGHQARERVVAYADIQAMAAQIAHIYENLFRRKG